MYALLPGKQTFSIKETFQSIREVLLHCMLIVSITWTPSNHLDKISDTQPTLVSQKFKEIVTLEFVIIKL